VSAHLSLEQLLALREPGVEPGTTEARAHLDGCPTCAEEFRRLEQRAARLRALPALRPARDQWRAVQGRLDAERRRRRARWAGMGSLALAASLLAAVVVRDLAVPARLEASTELGSVMAQSRMLEEAIRAYGPEARVVDGYTATVAGELEERIARLDRELESSQFLEEEERHEVMVQLWRERVGLLDALVDVHLASASNVGL
jgi:hypothetical protein